MSGIRRVAIVGVGLIGGSLGLALRARRPQTAVHGITKDDRQAAAALRSGAVSSASARLEDAAGAEVTVIATPLHATRGVLQRLDRAGAGGLISDVSSVKGPVVRWAVEDLAEPDRFLGSHPMAGRTENGIAAAQASLFEGAPWVFTPRAGQPLEPFEAWIECVRAVGAHPVMMDAEEHDRRVALVSHLAFLVSAAYVHVLRSTVEPERTAALAGPGFRDMIRLATGDPRMYAAIAEHNREPILAAVDRLEASLAEYRRLVLDGDPRLQGRFEESRTDARRWLRA